MECIAVSWREFCHSLLTSFFPVLVDEAAIHKSLDEALEAQNHPDNLQLLCASCHLRNSIQEQEIWQFEFDKLEQQSEILVTVWNTEVRVFELEVSLFALLRFAFDLVFRFQKLIAKQNVQKKEVSLMSVLPLLF